MDDLISRKAAIELIERMKSYHQDADDIAEMIANMPSAQANREYIEQIKWERDTAIAQLKEFGYGLGEKIRTDGDTISRQAAIDALHFWEKNYIWDEDCLNEDAKDIVVSPSKMIEKLPSTQPEQIWIPCSERLPDKECFVLVTVNDGAIYTDLSLFRHDGRFIEHTGDVIAWMPLPKPYMGGEEDV